MLKDLLVAAVVLFVGFVAGGFLWQAIDTENFPDVPAWCRPAWLMSLSFAFASRGRDKSEAAFPSDHHIEVMTFEKSTRKGKAKGRHITHPR